MNADSVYTFTQYYSPTWCYMYGVQGYGADSDYYSRGMSMYTWILEEKVYGSR